MDDLGDRMPSALMDEMWALLDGHQPCMLFEQLFLNWMPDTIRLQLTSPTHVKWLNSLWTTTCSGSALHKAMYSHHQTRTRPTGQAKLDDTTGKAKSNDTNSNAEWCIYHNRFGDKARKCVQPCKYPGNTQAGRQ